MTSKFSSRTASPSNVSPDLVTGAVVSEKLFIHATDN